MNVRPPPLGIACLAWLLTACPESATGTDSGIDDVVEDAGDAVADVPPPPLWPQPDPAAPRLIAPLSCSWHSSRRPTLRWERPAGTGRVVVEVCADRPCRRVEHTLESDGDSVRVPEELRPGVHFWRAFALVDGRRGPASFTWEFRAPFRSAPSDLSLGTYIDVNGDGFGDVLVGASNSVASADGLVYAFFGGPQGPAQQYSQRIDADGLISDLGDLNGDGFSDVMGFRFEMRNQRLTAAFEIYLGSPSGLRRPRTPFLRQWPGDGLPSGDSELFVTSLGDVNNDGYADLSHTHFSSTMSEPARVYLGGANGYEHARSFDVTTRPNPRLVFTRIYPIGDFNGDNQNDFLVEGVPSWPEGPSVSYRQYFVVSGEQLRNPSALGLRLDPPPTHWFRYPPSPHRRRYCDLNGDGRSEIYLQTTDGVGSATPTIAIYRWQGAMAPLAPSGFYNIQDSTDRDSFALVFYNECVPDLDGDGFNEIVTAGAESSNYIIFGSAQGPGQPTAFAHLLQTNESLSRLGRRCANDVNGDGRSDCAFLPSPGRDRIVIHTSRGHNMAPEEQFRLGASSPSGDSISHFLF